MFKELRSDNEKAGDDILDEKTAVYPYIGALRWWENENEGLQKDRKNEEDTACDCHRFPRIARVLLVKAVLRHNFYPCKPHVEVSAYWPQKKCKVFCRRGVEANAKVVVAKSPFKRIVFNHIGVENKCQEPGECYQESEYFTPSLEILKAAKFTCQRVFKEAQKC